MYVVSFEMSHWTQQMQRFDSLNHLVTRCILLFTSSFTRWQCFLLKSPEYKQTVVLKALKRKHCQRVKLLVNKRIHLVTGYTQDGLNCQNVESDESNGSFQTIPHTSKPQPHESIQHFNYFTSPLLPLHWSYHPQPWSSRSYCKREIKSICIWWGKKSWGSTFL